MNIEREIVLKSLSEKKGTVGLIVQTINVIEEERFKCQVCNK